jgi:hypothetical protein
LKGYIGDLKPKENLQISITPCCSDMPITGFQSWIFFLKIFFLFIFSMYQRYMITFIKVLTIYLNEINPFLHLSPFLSLYPPKSWIFYERNKKADDLGYLE